MRVLLRVCWFLSLWAAVGAFVVEPAATLRQQTTTVPAASTTIRTTSRTCLHNMSPKRRQQLGLDDGDDEYDLGRALDSNTDPLITKIIAGSLIVAILAGLVVGVIIPSTTDYGDGVCNPILTQGRC